ncbi:unnamed protein product [Vitrella brassicaformis CCMP3155]|uniref:HPP transmembrane region domain-containing protein n=2 Tax=Vitrella brassicaformis TaxID=1169539 RepID=A0A0G4G5B3_VITBC|nr:unnamed protein product [Vitrella brassicaformis CCMP3155]|eukprot:CEM23734.1 unnamed protein product [Vitrella brassicaformis CCMP3155]
MLRSRTTEFASVAFSTGSASTLSSGSITTPLLSDPDIPPPPSQPFVLTVNEVDSPRDPPSSPRLPSHPSLGCASNEAVGKDDVTQVQRCLQVQLENILHDCGFIYGEMWQPDHEQPGALRQAPNSVVIRHNSGAGDDPEKLQAFASMPQDKDVTLTVGQGPAGRAWQQGTREWCILDRLFDDPENPSTPMDTLAGELFHTSLAVPIFSMRRRLGVTAGSNNNTSGPRISGMEQLEREMAANSPLLMASHFHYDSLPVFEDKRALVAVFVFYTRKEWRVDEDKVGVKSPMVEAYLDTALRALQWELRMCAARTALRRHRAAVVSYGWRKLHHIVWHTRRLQELREQEAQHPTALPAPAPSTSTVPPTRKPTLDESAKSAQRLLSWEARTQQLSWADYIRERYRKLSAHPRAYCRRYIKKWRGGKGQRARPLDGGHCLLAALEVFVTFSLLTAVIKGAFIDESSFHLIGPFGAMATMYFTAPSSPFGQPRILLLSTLYALTVASVFAFFTHGIGPHRDEPLEVLLTGDEGDTFVLPAFLPYWLGVSLTMTIIIAGMAFFGITCPPAASAAVAFVAATPKVELSMWLFSFFIGWVVLGVVGLLINNLSPRRKWPLFW